MRITVETCENPYLILHKGLFPNEAGKFANEEAKKEAKAKLFERMVEVSSNPPAGYAQFLALMTSSLGEGRDVAFDQRVAVGLGVQTPAERGISLHPLFGTPVFPGSGIKGMLLREAVFQFGLEEQLASAGADDPESEFGKKPFAWQSLPATTDEQRTALRQMQALFGDIDGVGRLKVYDALWVPAQRPFLRRDVTTQHNKPYYQGDGYPDDTAGPNPISSVTLAKGTVMRFWLEAGDPEWTTACYDLLDKALARLGIGAKTSSGYGVRSASANTTGATMGAAQTASDVVECRVVRVQGNNVTVRHGEREGLLNNPPAGLERGQTVRARQRGRAFDYVPDA